MEESEPRIHTTTAEELDSLLQEVKDRSIGPTWTSIIGIAGLGFPTTIFGIKPVDTIKQVEQALEENQELEFVAGWDIYNQNAKLTAALEIEWRLNEWRAEATLVFPLDKYELVLKQVVSANGIVILSTSKKEDILTEINNALICEEIEYESLRAALEVYSQRKG